MRNAGLARLLWAAATFSLATPPSLAMETAEYLRLRRSSGYEPRLSYQQVAENAASFSGRVLELRGTVSGTLLRGEGLSFLLSTLDKQSALLDSPASEQAIVSAGNTPAVRVLVRVAEGVVGNIPKFQVLAIASEAEVSVKEREASQRIAAAQSRKRAAPPRTVRLASRGYTVRPVAGAAAGVSEMALKYLTPEAQALYPAYFAFIRRCNPRLSGGELDSIAVSLLHFSQRFAVDPRLVVAMVMAESGFNPSATSRAGAMGLGQLMPPTARTLGVANPYDPVWNLRGAIDHLRSRLDLYREAGTPQGRLTWRQVVLAMAAYNAGSGAVKRHGGVPPYRETQRYIEKVLGIYRQLVGAS